MNDRQAGRLPGELGEDLATHGENLATHMQAGVQVSPLQPLSSEPNVGDAQLARARLRIAVVHTRSKSCSLRIFGAPGACRQSYPAPNLPKAPAPSFSAGVWGCSEYPITVRGMLPYDGGPVLGACALGG